MSAQIITPQKTYPLDLTCTTVLEAIQKAGIEFAAPCGGAGTCKKCDVLVRDEQGLRNELSCQIKPTENMIVQIEQAGAMSIVLEGSKSSFKATVGQTGYGLAIDVGTTTVVMRLVELSSGEIVFATSRPNPQVVFGADVIARISAASEGKLGAMQTLICSALADMADFLAQKAHIDPSEISCAVLAANTVMESIAAGVNPQSIGVTPFIPESYFGQEIDLFHVSKHTYFVRCLSGYVGGDITADIVAQRLCESQKLKLILDLGTNGEMVLGNKDRILTCATAAGPVFEGANIVFGMPARAGAISSVTLVGDDIEIRTIADAEPFGICGTGIIDAASVLLQTGIVDETGYLCNLDGVSKNLSAKLAARLIDYNGQTAFELAPGICITQADIRNIQLAKSAICAGALTLVEELGISLDDIDELLIAGGFGSFLNIQNAARIGLFPESLKNRAKSIGNASVEGAMALLINTRARAQEKEIANLAEYVELSSSMRFNQLYVDCMMFPEE